MSLACKKYTNEKHDSIWYNGWKDAMCGFYIKYWDGGCVVFIPNLSNQIETKEKDENKTSIGRRFFI